MTGSALDAARTGSALDAARSGSALDAARTGSALDAARSVGNQDLGSGDDSAVPGPAQRVEPLSAARLAVGRAKIVVVKVGSSSLTTSAGGLDPARLDALVDAVAGRVAAGSQVVLVSSGAIAAGLAPLGLHRRPRDLATQQAAASVGQQLLAERYATSFARHRLTVGQILLTSDDVVRRAHYRNAQRTFGKLLSFGVVPVVNENDTVATAEIRFGDNDRLAALVAHLVGAGALILLSDVDALYTGDPRVSTSVPVREVPDAGALAGIGIASTGSDVGTGGMESKLTSALTATGAGIPVLLASAADAVAALRTSSQADSAGADSDGPTVGTAFAPATRRTSARLFWLRHAATASGSISLDSGAVAAVLNRRKSLLPAGITDFYGDFESGDVVDLLAPSGEIVARGFVGHDAAEMPTVIRRTLSDLPAELRHPVVHADDLIAMPTASRPSHSERSGARSKVAAPKVSEPVGAEFMGVEPRGAAFMGVEPTGAAFMGVEPTGAAFMGAEPTGAGSRPPASQPADLQASGSSRSESAPAASQGNEGA